MSFQNLLRPFAPLALVVLATAPMAAQTRADQTFRDTMTTGFRNAGVEHRVTPDLASLGLSSTPSLLAGAVAVPTENGLDGALRGEPFALAYLDGGRDATVAPGYYRLAVGPDGAALLLNSTGGTAATGQASFDLTAVIPGTNKCWIDFPHPNDDIVCVHCQFGGPNWPGGPWGFNTCLTIFVPHHND